MVEASYWEKGTKHQEIFFANDNSSLERLSEKIDPNMVFCSSSSELVNLGVKRINGRLYSGNYIGVCRLRGVDGKYITTYDGKEVILKIEPRFPVSVVEMLNNVSTDDEFESYLAPQTTRTDASNQEIEDLYDNELFKFNNDEELIYIKDGIAHESSIITASIFITLLKGLCKRPLMGKMIRNEENLVGKAKGKIVFSKNIRKNVLKGREDRLYCRYLKYDEDILENRILKAALKKSELFLNKYFGSVSGIKNSYREMISYCSKALDHVSYAKITRTDLLKIKTAGVYVYYKPVINTAKMVLNEITIGSTGNSIITSYIVPYAISMEKLFEIYVRAFLKKAGVKSYDYSGNELKLLKYDEKVPVLMEKGNLYSNYIRGNIKPDIIIFNPVNNRYLIFDVKYKNAISTRFSRADRLQLLAYCLMFDSINVGNIFPAHAETKNIYFKCNEINTKELKNRYYNQIEISLRTNWDFTFYSRDTFASVSVLDYLKLLLN